ncbi:MAG: DMT family transporter [Bacteroidales bacterium]|nr:DMT family transporter [Bacteroidales bacterium]
MNNSLTKTYIGIILATIFWGLSFIGTAYLLKFLNPVTILTFRLIIAVIFLFILIKSFNLYQPLKKKHLKYFIILSIIEPYAYFMGETYSLKHLSAIVVSLIISTIPLFIPFADFLIYKTKIKILNITGIVISIIGIIFTLISENININISLVGIIFVYVAVFSAVGYTVLLKKIASEYKAINIIFYQNLLGLPYFIVTLILLGDFEFKNILAIQEIQKILFILLLLAIFPTSLAYMFYTYSIEKIGITKTGAFVNFIPIVTLVASSIIFKEPLTLLKITGIILVIVGLFIAQKH